MDTSISDILASVTRAHNQASGYDDSNAQKADFQLLTRAWISERTAPELLPYPTELMARTMIRIKSQIESIEDRTSRTDAGASFVLVMLQTELERMKFLVRSFMRTRISKIDAHLQYNLKMHQDTPTLSVLDLSNPLLSESEALYAQRHAAMLLDHYAASFLSSFPPKLRQLDDKAGAGGVAMVGGPDLDQAVFVRCLGRPTTTKTNRYNGHDPSLMDDEGDRRDAMEQDEEDGFSSVEVSCGFGRSQRRNPAGETNDAQRSGNETVVQMKRGQIWIVRWSSVREAVARGECELI